MPDAFRPGRRGLLAAGGVGLATVSAAGCDLLSTDPDSGQGSRHDAKRDDAAKEAPSLQRQVEAGKLPPLKDRLPDEPLVLDPVDKPGTYGGEWDSVLAGAGDTVWLTRTIGYDSLVGWNLDFTRPVPNVCASVDAGGGGRTYTFHLRKGLKWSDGKPFTADDIVFWYDDVVHRSELGGVVPLDLTIGGKDPRVDKVDDLTVRFSYPEPHGLLLDYLATTTGIAATRHPFHYLKKFHAKYNPDVDTLVQNEKGVSNWAQLFLNRSDPWGNPDLPALTAWQITVPIGETNRMVAERNPYYFKTDRQGRQLPYLDRVVFDVIDDPEVTLLKASNGALSMEPWHINTVTNKPVLARNRSKGGFRFFDMKWSWMNRMVIQFNLNHEDDGMRRLFQDKQFRIGLSYAINRQEMIDAVFQRQGEPWQAAPYRDSGYFHKRLAEQYTSYDVHEAERRLDRAGYADRDEHGIRLRPDGRRVAFAVEFPSNAGIDTFFVDAMEIVEGYWKKIGIDVELKPEDRSLWQQHMETFDFDVTVWSGDGGRHDAILDPRYYLPTVSGYSHWAPLWANWYTGATPAEKPPAATRRQMDLYEKLKGTRDRGRQRALFQQILDIAAEEFYHIGTVLPQGDYGIKKNAMANVPEPMILSWMYPTPGPTRPEQYFIEGA